MPKHSNKYNTNLIITENMHQRKQMMYEKSDAFLILPGGVGTLDECFEVLTWCQLNQIVNKKFSDDIIESSVRGSEIVFSSIGTTQSKVNGDILLLNCSRDVEKLEMVKKIINQKKLNYFEFRIWNK